MLSGRQRRHLSHAFSDKALREQEPLIQGYIDLLTNQLHSQVAEDASGEIDLVRWYNYTTFDIVVDLVLGRSLNCLRDKEYHPLASMIYKGIKALGLAPCLRRYPALFKVAQNLVFKKGSERRQGFFNFVVDLLNKRSAAETSRPDFMTYLLSHKNDEHAMTPEEIQANAGLLILAGTDTTATLLSGTTYLLLKNPDKLKKLKEEVRGQFKSMHDITVQAVNNLPYLLAVLNEGLRVYPPVPTGFARLVPPGGGAISGYWLPENVSASAPDVSP